MIRHRYRALSLLILALAAATSDAAAPAKPNILFIFADDCGIDSFSPYGSDFGKDLTPNIKKLAEDGTRFERCYASPLCGPSRVLIMTGRYPFRTGGLTNQTAGNASYKTEPQLAGILKDAGYATGMAGKWRQMSDTPADWGFGEYITDPTAGGWYWKNSYFKNGQEVKTDKEIYYPDVCSDFAVDFIKRHKDEPFYFYLSEHLIHGPILKTPDSKPDATPAELYVDNLKYLDKTVGKMVQALDDLGLREKTIILFSSDNGTATVGYQPQHDPNKIVGHIGGKAVHGHKGQVLEGGCRVPLIANWKGVLKPGEKRSDLIDFTDLLPTFADLAGAKLPADVKFDGKSFAPQLRGEKGSPREWIYVQLGANWYARNDGFKLNEKGELFAMKDSPFVEALVPADSKDAAAAEGRKQLAAVLAELNPEGGIKATRPMGDAPAGKRRRRRQQQQQQNQTPPPKTDSKTE
jgi:arylsulfatase A